MSPGTPFAWSAEHREFRAVLRKGFAADDPVARARDLLDDPGRPDGTWAAMCERLDLAGLALPEEHGGAGFGRVETAIVGEEMGRVLLGGPYLPTVVLAAEAIVRSGDAAAMSEHLPAIAAGERRAALAVAEDEAAWDLDRLRVAAADGPAGSVLTGRKRMVLGGADADVLVVAAREDGGTAGLFLVDAAAPGVAVRPERALDATRPSASLDLRETPARRLGARGDAARVLRLVREHAAIFLAAGQAAGARACVDLTAGYARTRVQFGRPIGAFQGVKHRLADMLARAEQAHSAAVWAAWQEPGTADADLGASVARAYCSDAFLQNALDTVQLHGGIGITWEHDAHLYLRRAQADAALLGRTGAERRRLEEHLAGRPAGREER
ncbi:acyl-CoA dehydrogenase family protein [Actinomadura algeriensis]|uniref:Alkylation response protein AidB-like acyl-CoA dehydrogenase n=1 Tax=Actinomadura algeriensis TaxID=1679523 RepID=A0ABR9JZ83_9ACTN|nr:acyl-CoA dehydrogenase family protein [Actinomadura algeriensis]MBE1535892.1 alkylation response protein AidB-like acyl-CoA dehydrogenase [Actinomadura algeriensis]